MFHWGNTATSSIGHNAKDVRFTIVYSKRLPKNQDNQFFYVRSARANVAIDRLVVDFAATVKLITHAVGATTRNKTLGRAEARAAPCSP